MLIEMHDFGRINAYWIRDKQLKVFRKVRKICFPGYFRGKSKHMNIDDKEYVRMRRRQIILLALVLLQIALTIIYSVKSWR